MAGMANKLRTSLHVGIEVDDRRPLTDAADAVEAVSEAARTSAPGLDALAEAQQRVAHESEAAQAALDKIELDALAADIDRVGLDRFADELERLAAEGGAMAPQFAQAARELRALQAGADVGAAAVGRMGGEARDTQSELGALGNAANDLQTRLSGVAKAVAGVFAVGKLQGYARDAIAVADAYGQMASRIEMATRSSEEYDLVQARLLATASATYRPLAEAQELYIRTADALRSMGYETEQSLDITDSFSYLLVNNAASADKAAAAVDAYSKSIQRGKVDADAWATIMAAMPTVVDAIAKATGRSAAEIRALGVTGKLAVQELNEGLRQTVEANKAVADSMPTTVADALTRLSTVWGAYIGEANRASGATQRVVGLINAVTDNLDALVSTAMKAGNVLVAVFAARAVLAVQGYAAAALAAGKAVQATAAATAGQGAAAATAAPQVASAAAATAAHGRAAAGAAGAVGASAAATERQGAAAAAASRGVGGLARVLGALRFTGLTLAVSMVIELASKLLFAKSAAEQAAEAVTRVVEEADFSDADGVGAFIEQLEEVGRAADASGEQVEQALSARIKTLSGEQLAALRDGLVEALRAGGEQAAALGVALGAVDARLADIAERANWGRTVATDAAAARFELTALQRTLRDVAGDAAGVGKALGEALTKADFGSADGVRAILADLQLVQDSALATGAQIEQALGDRLSQLSAKGLRELALQAEVALGRVQADAQAVAVAFAQGEVSADEHGHALARLAAESANLARINDQVLNASFARLGVNAAQAMGRVSPAAQDAIDSVENIVAALTAAGTSAQQAGEAIAAALDQAVVRADSAQALEVLRAKVEAWGRAGTLSGAQVAAALDQIKSKSDALTPGINSAAEAMKRLGVVSDTELRRAADAARESYEAVRDMGGSVREQAEAFRVYAEAAIAANGGVATAALQVQAAQHGLRIEADEAGKTVVRSMKEAAEATAKLREQAEGSATAMKGVAEAAEGVSVSLVQAARTHNSSLGAVAGSWLDARMAASRYADEARQAVFDATKSVDELRAAFAGYVAQMDALDARQRALDGGAQRGVADLRLRLLELEGTQEQVAQARYVRDKEERAAQLALLEIEIERAQLRGDGAAAEQARARVAALHEELRLLGRIHEAEQRQVSAARVAQTGAPSGTPTAAAVGDVHVHIAGVLDVNDPVTLDALTRKIRPVLGELARRGA